MLATRWCDRPLECVSAWKRMSVCSGVCGRDRLEDNFFFCICALQLFRVSPSVGSPCAEQALRRCKIVHQCGRVFDVFVAVLFGLRNVYSST